MNNFKGLIFQSFFYNTISPKEIIVVYPLSLKYWRLFPVQERSCCRWVCRPFKDRRHCCKTWKREYRLLERYPLLARFDALDNKIERFLPL